MRTDICSCYKSTARERDFGENSECNQRAIKITIERSGRGVNPTKDVLISTIVPLHNLRRFINRSVSLIRVFECQLCHIEDGDTVIGRVGRCHIAIVMPLAADHDHLVCCLGGVASVC